MDGEGFLAKSLCHFRAWSSADPLREALDPVTPSLCLSSAFSYPDVDTDKPAVSQVSRLPVFASVETARDEDPPASQESAIEQHFGRSVVDFRVETRLVQVAIAREHDAPRLSVDILEAWTADGEDGSLSWRPGHSEEADASARRLLVVSSIQQGGVNYVSYPDGETGSQTLARHTSGLLSSTPVNVSAIGEGFHRRVAIDVDARGIVASGCDPAASRVLVRVPLSHEVYADLDELRVRSCSGGGCELCEQIAVD